jgi:hypothetical protein
MTSLSLPDSKSLWVEQAAECLTLEPSFDGARIKVMLKTWTQNADKNQFPTQVTATVKAGASTDPRHARHLAELRADDLVYAMASPSQVTLTGHVSAQALREVEEERQGGALWLMFELKSTTVSTGTPTQLFLGTGTGLAVKVLAGQWAEELEKVTATSFVEILIPVTDDPEFSLAAARLRKARDLIRNGEFTASATELRRALEPVRRFYKTLDVHSMAAPKPAKERSKEERFAVYVQSVFHWITSFVHDEDDSIKGCEMDRAEANQALAAVAGLLHRMARDQADRTI